MTPGTVSAVEELLLRADQLLSGELPTGSANPNRTACWVARRALELVVLDLLTRRSVRTGTATMRSLLICLSTTYQDQPGPVVTAQSAWTSCPGLVISMPTSWHPPMLSRFRCSARFDGWWLSATRGSLDSSRWSSR